MSFQPVKRIALWSQIADQIAMAIVDGQLLAGEPLPTERELVKRFGASRASIREALRALEARGLLVPDFANPSQPRVVAFNGASGELHHALAQLLRLERVRMADLVEFRCVLEAAGVRQAAVRKDVGRIHQARLALEEAVLSEGSVDTFEASDIRFHVALIGASGNEVMLLVMQALRETVTRRFFDTLKAVEHPRVAMHKLNVEHGAILEAVHTGDGEEAAALMVHHIRDFYDKFAGAPTIGGDGDIAPEYPALNRR